MKKRRVKRKLKVGRILLVVLVSVILVGVSLFGIKYLLKSDNKPITKPKEEEKEKVYTASVITAGDNLIHSSVYKDANKNANYNGYDFKPMYEYIKPIVSEYDIAYYNQEIVNYLPNYKTTYETYKQVVQKYNEDMYVVPAYE